MGRPADADVTFCIPVFNDWQYAVALLKGIDEAVGEQGWRGEVLFVDDGSMEAPADGSALNIRHLSGVKTLRLRCNVGHQRAIALGLTHIYLHRPCQVIVVMDGDGEDEPADAVRLAAQVRQAPEPRMVFAQRSRRSEGLLFRFGYWSYQWVHRLLVGRTMDVGNFSAIPGAWLERLICGGDLWNHYAAAVMKSGLPVIKTPIPRGRRLGGESRMSFVNLVSHGLSAISVWSETVGARLLIASSILVILSLAGISVVVAIRLLTDLAIPGWATTAVVGLAIILMNGVLFCLAFSFLVLRGRTASSFLLLRDHAYFISGIGTLYENR